MKRKSPFIVALLCLLAVLAGCTSTVTVSYMKPSRVNMGPYRNIAIAETRKDDSFGSPAFYVKAVDKASAKEFGRVHSSYNMGLADTVAKDATEKLVDALRATEFFDILPPEKTEEILGKGSLGYSRRELFMKRGIDAVILPKVEKMKADEWIESRVREVSTRNGDGSITTEIITDYYYKWEVFVSWSYTVIDAETEEIVARNLFKKSASGEEKLDPAIAFYPNGFRSDISMILDEFMRGVRTDLVPTVESMSISLMKDKTGIREAEEAYDMLEDGRYLTALEALLDVWKETGSIPAGYNAALLLGGTGKFEEAIDLLDDVVMMGGGDDARYLRAQMKTALKSNRETESQLEKGKPEAGTGPDIYDMLDV